MATEQLERIWPVVLVGGKSRRFGRDKLKEPLPGRPRCWLVDVAIGALRSEFGRVVSVVGECDPLVSARADMVIPDGYPGVGPIGGVLSALEYSRESVLVLPGDVQHVDDEVARRLCSGAKASRAADAIVLRTDREQWCVGVFRPTLIDTLRAAVASRSHAIHESLCRASVSFVDLPPSSYDDADSPQDLW